MNNPLRSSSKRPPILIGTGIGIYLVVSYFLGVLVGFIVNTALFIGIILYIRKKQTAGIRYLVLMTIIIAIVTTSTA